MGKKYFMLLILFILLITTLFGCQIHLNPGFSVQEPLLYYYSFDSVEGGKVQDLSGNHFDATVTAASLVAGKVGNALNFSVPGAKVKLPVHFDVNGYYDYLPNNQISICAWICLTASNPGSANHIVGTGYSESGWGSFFLRVQDSKVEYYMCQDNAAQWFPIIQSNTIIDAGKWYYIVLTYDCLNAILYINGVQDNTNNIIMSFPDFANDLSVGGTETGCNFNGEIDELKIYNNIITSSEIMDYYNQTKGGVK